MWVKVSLINSAGGPKGNWTENRPENTDTPTSSSKAKKAYLRVKKSKELASNGKQIADNDLAEKDYTGNRITTNPPAKAKEVLNRGCRIGRPIGEPQTQEPRVDLCLTKNKL